MYGNSIDVVFTTDSVRAQETAPPTRFREVIERSQLYWRASVTVVMRGVELPEQGRRSRRRRRRDSGVVKTWGRLGTGVLLHTLNAPRKMFQFLILPRNHVRHLLLCILEKGNPAFNVNQTFIVHRRILWGMAPRFTNPGVSRFVQHFVEAVRETIRAA